MPTYKVFKETALPAQLEPSSIYFVTSDVNVNYLEIYVSDMTGSSARRVLRQQDVEAMIAMAVGGAGVSHTHTNKSQLDKVGEDSDGNLTYGGNLPVASWSSVNW